jgi:serine/threonine protein kinase
VTIINSPDMIGMNPAGYVLDAERISDGKAVMIKHAATASQEVDIGLYFSSESIRSDPENHCVPILDTFPDPRTDDRVFLVMPLLREWNKPPFHTVAEILDGFEQILQGITFMHRRNVAHRDAASPNWMMDASAMYPEGFHPYMQHNAKDARGYQPAKALTRSQAPPKYYLIDFGISTQFKDNESRTPVVGMPGRSRAPELSDTELYDPFAVDIFAYGEALLHEIQTFLGLDSFLPLAQKMMNPNPASRPTAEQALQMFREIRQSLSWRQAGALLFSRSQSWAERAGITVYETIGLTGIAAIGMAVVLYRFRSSFTRRRR